MLLRVSRMRLLTFLDLPPELHGVAERYVVRVGVVRVESVLEVGELRIESRHNIRQVRARLAVGAARRLLARFTILLDACAETIDAIQEVAIGGVRREGVHHRHRHRLCVLVVAVTDGLRRARSTRGVRATTSAAKGRAVGTSDIRGTAAAERVLRLWRRLRDTVVERQVGRQIRIGLVVWIVEIQSRTRRWAHLRGGVSEWRTRGGRRSEWVGTGAAAAALTARGGSGGTRSTTTAHIIRV